MSRPRKTHDEYRVHVNYGDGFEEVHATLTRREARDAAADYRKNAPAYPVKCTGPHRVKGPAP